jgi:hypothetical protein
VQETATGCRAARHKSAADLRRGAPLRSRGIAVARSAILAVPHHSVLPQGCVRPPPCARPVEGRRRTFLQKVAEFIHPGPDTRDELIETLADAEDNDVIGAESRVMLEGVLRMADLTAGDVMVAAPRMDLVNIDSPYDEILHLVIDTAHSRFPVYEGDARTSSASCSPRTCSSCSARPS